uniref:Uncharacterized protein n=1 Tax=Arundo donax TaxID=35708 RepID=A0A0A9U5C8_ARUDO
MALVLVQEFCRGCPIWHWFLVQELVFCLVIS